ncbi:hypothetical protein J6590_098539 [Homalodisca vitripennis]|nr:hypothetical protein J6590_098539 [Homalodisca vitripennis]
MGIDRSIYACRKRRLKGRRALACLTPCQIVQGRVRIKSQFSRQKMAILALGARDAEKLLTESHIKIVWAGVAYVNSLCMASRFFQYLSFCNVAKRCRGPDKSSICNKCGGQFHMASTCTAAESCVLRSKATLKS